MIQLITGEKGKGKTKVLLDKANEAAKNAKGKSERLNIFWRSDIKWPGIGKDLSLS